MSSRTTRGTTSSGMSAVPALQPVPVSQPVPAPRPAQVPQPVPVAAFPSSSSLQDILQAVVKLSLTSGEFVDTKFYVFSRRTTSGIVKTPRVVFGNSLSLVQASIHFERLLSGGFAESLSGGLDTSSYADEQVSADIYGYESDSDIEDEEEGCIGDIRETVSSTQPQEALHNRPVGEGSTVGEDAAKGSVSQDVESSGNLAESTSSTIRETHLVPKELGQAHRTIFVKDMAFRTWQAFIYYTYFEKVNFSPLRSQTGTSRKVVKGHRQTELYQPPLCSPKSMYRLADKYDLKDLRELAKNDIKQKLTEDNILVELFSHFTSNYSEILELEIQFISDNSHIKTKVLTSIPQWMESVAAGHQPHSAEVLISLFQNLMNSTD
ncbi:hypothetical protein B0H21DRAFT_52118 [Amylocystis lapponica]|nr:hypothetical protein B0H21DRAFT_52118 [Amylocystis lapponica]